MALVLNQKRPRGVKGMQLSLTVHLPWAHSSLTTPSFASISISHRQDIHGLRNRGQGPASSSDRIHSSYSLHPAAAGKHRRLPPPLLSLGWLPGCSLSPQPYVKSGIPAFIWPGRKPCIYGAAPLSPSMLTPVKAPPYLAPGGVP